MSRKETLAALVLAALAFLALDLWAVHARYPLYPQGVLRDFNAFYCGGHVLNSGADPFRAEPLGTCERVPKPYGLFSLGPNLVMPVPHPGYVLALFSVLARLPFVAAAALWTLLSIAVIALASVVLKRLTGFPLSACFCASALSAGYASIMLGQVVPITFCLIVLAAWYAQQERDTAAALCASAAMIEPHLGLPACLSLFVWRARTRPTFVAAALVLGSISIFALGVDKNVEYLRTVLPAHALSEVPNVKQLSLTYLAHRLGASDETAVRIGDLWYALMLAAGTLLAAPLARRAGTEALLVAFPCALAVLGGPFVHVIEVSIAVPAALILASRIPRYRVLFALCAIALAIPWTQGFNLGAIFPVYGAIVAAIMTYDLITKRPLAVAGAAVTIFAFFIYLIFAVTPFPDATAQLAKAYDPSALSQASWSLYVRIIGEQNILLYDITRLPTWIALAALAAGAVAVVRAPIERAGLELRGDVQSAAAIPRPKF